jgi:hypothetical protein
MTAASASAISTNAVSLRSVSAWRGVLLRLRRVQVVNPSGASKTASAGGGVARKTKV